MTDTNGSSSTGELSPSDLLLTETTFSTLQASTMELGLTPDTTESKSTNTCNGTRELEETLDTTETDALMLEVTTKSMEPISGSTTATMDSTKVGGSTKEELNTEDHHSLMELSSKSDQEWLPTEPSTITGNTLVPANTEFSLDPLSQENGDNGGLSTEEPTPSEPGLEETMPSPTTTEDNSESRWT